MGPFVAYGELCLWEFSKSLVDRAYTWYTVLLIGSIRTWEDMVESFWSKYFHAEEKITLVNLHSTRQLIGEDLVKYIHHFRDVSLDFHVKCQDGELVEVCIDNMLPEFRAHLENLDISRFASLLQKARKMAVCIKPQVEKEKVYEEPPPLPFTAEEMMAIFDKWVKYEVIKLPQVTKQPTVEEKKDPKYCRYHRYVHHPTIDCQTLRWEVNQSGATCFTVEAHTSRAFLETTNAITFTDEDMKVQHPDHRRPLYLFAVVKDVQVRRALVDTDSCLNLIPLSTLQAANVSQQKIQGSPIEVTGFGGVTKYTMGHVQLVLRIGVYGSEDRKSTTAEPKMTAKEELEVINLNDNPDVSKPISISMSLSAEERKYLIDLLHEYKDVFAWDYDEMLEIDSGLVAHSLNVELGTRPVVQPKRTFHTKVEAQITQEMKKLLAVGFIKPIQHPRWLSNIVPVKKKNGQIRYCVDFCNLNKACLKEEFLLPNMDLLIDSATGHAMFSFMDGFNGYNQIRMSTKDAEKTAFRTPIDNFYYTVMPFGLKNVGVTYQRTMTAMFHDMMHREIEDYVDDIVVKSKKREDHLETLRKQAFKKIQAIMTKLPTVCALVASRLLRLYLASNGEAIGALVAYEDEGGTKKLVYYVNRAFKDAETMPVLFGRLARWLLQLSQYEIITETPIAIKSQAIADLLAQFPGEDSSSISHEVPGGVGKELLTDLAKSEFSLKELSLTPYRALSQQLEEKFDTFEIFHAMRCGNHYADALVTLGSQISFEGPKIDVTINKRSVPITNLLKEEFEEHHLDTEDWRTTIKAKLMSPEGVADLKTFKDYVLIAGVLYRRLPGGVLARCVSLREALLSTSQSGLRSFIPSLHKATGAAMANFIRGSHYHKLRSRLESLEEVREAGSPEFGKSGRYHRKSLPSAYSKNVYRLGSKAASGLTDGPNG
uniref:Reverse transcriptase domain-containing protein n=1 Tax=Fagus sylvatica TaxID=28930 RepID=A0A2N9HGT5_FAGSY